MTEATKKQTPEPAPDVRVVLPLAAMDTPIVLSGYATTLRQLCASLAAGVFAKGESFSGKRPFGCSGWDVEVHSALVEAGHVPGWREEEDGFDPVYVPYADCYTVNAAIADLIRRDANPQREESTNADR